MTTDEVAPARPGRASRAASEGNWFFVIAGLSAANTMLGVIGLPIFFVGALAAPLLVGIHAHRIAPNLSIAQADRLTYGSVVACVAILCALGAFARKGHLWAFVLGGLLYLADSIAFLSYHDYLSFAFHLIILCFILSGLVGILRSRPTPRRVSADPTPVPAVDPPRDNKPARPGSLYPH